jgi:predicted ATPase
MHIRLTKTRHSPPKDFPSLLLTPDSWDDYGFKTLFSAAYWRSSTEHIDLGAVKILRKGQEKGRTEIPEKTDRLAEDYCSLGQEVAYYEMLRKLPRAEYEEFFRATRDVVYDPLILATFESERGFKDSLLRSTAADTAIRIAPALFPGQRRSDHPGEAKLHFKTTVGGASFVVSFDFADDGRLPARINAVIGYNGSGKTQMLANLAMVAATGRSSKDFQRIQQKYGEFIQSGESFGSVIAISYSAFDTFDVPGSNVAQRTRVSTESGLLGYSYCGLRDLAAAQKSGKSRSKSFDDLADEFEERVKAIYERDRQSLFFEIVGPLVHEASFQRIGVLAHLSQSAEDWRREFCSFSSGHKVVLSVAAHLAAYLQKQSLVIFDEPEAHLHPPLLAALLKCIRIALDRQYSYAVVATHSPVVLQETPAKFVRIMRRLGNSTSISTPSNETFGENIGILTRDVFDLNTSDTDFHETLNKLAEDLSVVEIEQLFGRSLGFQSRSYIESIRHAAGHEQ